MVERDDWSRPTCRYVFLLRLQQFDHGFRPVDQSPQKTRQRDCATRAAQSVPAGFYFLPAGNDPMDAVVTNYCVRVTRLLDPNAYLTKKLMIYAEGETVPDRCPVILFFNAKFYPMIAPYRLSTGEFEEFQQVVVPGACFQMPSAVQIPLMSRKKYEFLTRYSGVVLPKLGVTLAHEREK